MFRMVMKKKGVSDVVSTVLIILLVVAAVAIVGAIILRTVNNASTAVDASVICQNLQVVPTKCTYSPTTTTTPTVLVQRKEGGSELVLNDITIIYNKGEIESRTFSSISDLPLVNEIKSFIPNPVLTTAASPDSVKVAFNVIDSKGKVILCSNSLTVSCTDVVPPVAAPATVNIDTQPTPDTVLVGGSATFSVTASGSLSLYYQWQKDGLNLTDGAEISGATTQTLTVSNVQLSHAGSYSVYVSGGVNISSVMSNSATLTVNSAPPVAASAGPNNGTSFVSDASIGSYSWTSPDGAQFDDDTNYATTGSFAFGGITQYLKASDFGFNIPVGAAITGIEVVVKKRSNTFDSSTEVEDNSVKLVKDGTISGDDKSLLTVWNRGFVWVPTTYGSSSDLWGQTWTPSDINNVNFGVALSAKRDSGGSGAVTLDVDHIKITVHYTTP